MSQAITKAGGQGLTVLENLESTIKSLESCQELAGYMYQAMMIPESYKPGWSEQAEYKRQHGGVDMPPELVKEITVSRASIAIVKGLSMGLDPLEALSNMYVVGSRVEIYGHLLTRLIQEHPDYEYHVADYLEDSKVILAVKLTAKRKSQENPVHVIYGIKDAELAGLVVVNPEDGSFWNQSRQGDWVKGNWAKHPKEMLLWKAMKRLRDRYFADVATGMDVKEDMDGNREEDQWVKAEDVSMPTSPGAQIEVGSVAKAAPTKASTKTLADLYEDCVSRSRSLDENVDRLYNIENFIDEHDGLESIKLRDPEVADKAAKMLRKYTKKVDEEQAADVKDTNVPNNDELLTEVEYEEKPFPDSLDDVEVIDHDSESDVVDSGPSKDEVLEFLRENKDKLTEKEYEAAEEHAAKDPAATKERLDVLIKHTHVAVTLMVKFIQDGSKDPAWKNYQAGVHLMTKEFADSANNGDLTEAQAGRVRAIEILKNMVHPTKVAEMISKQQ